MRDLYAEVTAKMIDALEGGIVPWRKPWTSLGPHRNLTTGHEYRGINVLLTTLSAMRGGYSYPLWVTMRQANRLGGHVRRGERGTMVVFWQPRVDIRKNDKGEEEKVRRLVFKQYHVWNVEQVEGLVLPKLPDAAGASTHEAAEAIWQGYADRPDLRYGGNQAYYVEALDTIQMPPQRTFVDTSAYYYTLFHEATHSTGAKKRLNRSTLTQMGKFGDENYSQEELVAEIGAAMLLARAGMEPNYANHGAYIRGWLRALQNDRRLVVVAAQQAEKAVRFLLSERAPAEDAPPEEGAVA